MLVRSAAGAYYTLGITSRGCEAAKRAAKEEVARTARRRQRVADSASEADRGGSDSAMLVYCCLCLLFVCCPHFPRKRAIQLMTCCGRCHSTRKEEETNTILQHGQSY